MAIEVFNRFEKKYMIDSELCDRIIEAMSFRMEPDKYCRNGDFYSISNIYYDTVDDRLIRNSIQKPVYKEKLRLRAYGVPKDDSQSFLEIKKKYAGLVNKRRIVLPLSESLAYLEKEVTPTSKSVNQQVLREIDYFRNFYKLVPKVYISYDRRAFFDKNDKDFRVTFDTNIQTRREDLDLRSGMYGRQLLPEGKWLMEVKISDAMPLWFTEILSELKVYQTSFSKYGTEYKRYVKENIKDNEGGINRCSNQFSQQPTLQFQQLQRC